MKTKKLQLGLPKGSLEEATYRLFEKAGFKITARSRSYYPIINDDEIDVILLRPQEMPRYVEDGIVDAGLTGYDWIVESGARVEEILDLTYAKQTRQPVRWVLAVKEGSQFKSVKDLQDKKIATELVNVTKKYLRKNKVTADVEFSWGATEVKPPTLADAIVEVTETGSSLRANNLRVIDTVLESSTKFIAHKQSLKNPWKKEKIENIALLLNGAIQAEGKVGLKMNVRKEKLRAILDILPALQKPTVSQLSDHDWLDVDTIIDEIEVRKIIPALKKAGASGIVEYPLNKVIC